MKEVKDRKPTEQAEYFFSTAANAAAPAILGKGLKPTEEANVLHKIAAGLEMMAVGLRATYILLEQVSAQIARLSPPAGASGTAYAPVGAGNVTAGVAAAAIRAMSR